MELTEWKGWEVNNKDEQISVGNFIWKPDDPWNALADYLVKFSPSFFFLLSFGFFITQKTFIFFT